MPTYYEVLQISSTATLAEIEAACEAQYKHWRRLVTHHDPQVVHKAISQVESQRPHDKIWKARLNTS